MKQRITIDQLNQLTNEQKQRLREWWKPQISDTFAYPHFDGEWSDILVIDRESYEPPEDSFPLLSIGQMIEVIQDIGKFKFGRLEDVAFDNLGYKGLGLSFMLDLVDLTEKRKIKVREFNTEICDLLWEGVKQTMGE